MTFIGYSASRFDPFEANAMAEGAAIGACFAIVTNAVVSIFQAEASMNELEATMAAHDNPQLQYAPIKREFMLSHLDRAGTYLFSTLPKEIETLRKINIDLNTIAAKPLHIFYELKKRIYLAGDGLFDDAKAIVFAEIIDQPVSEHEPFDPATSDLHQPFENIERAKKQHEFLVKKARGATFRGDYSPDSEMKEITAQAMTTEIGVVRNALELIADRLYSENLGLSRDIKYARESFPWLIRLYKIAAAAYQPYDDPQLEAAAVEQFSKLFALMDKTDGFGKALSAVADIIAAEEKTSQKEG